MSASISRRQLLSLLGGSVASVTACGQPARTVDAETGHVSPWPLPDRIHAAEEQRDWKIGVVLPLSGSMASLGSEVRKGIDLASSELERRSPGLRWIFEDEASSADGAVAATEKLVSDPKTIAVLGSVSSVMTLRAAIVAEKAGVTLLTPTATQPMVTKVGPHVFRACFVDSVQGSLAAEYCVDVLQSMKVGLLSVEGDPYSMSIADTFRKSVRDRGGMMVLDEIFDHSERTFGKELATLVSKGPEIVFAPVYYDQMLLLAREASARGIPMSRFVGGDGWSDPSLFAAIEGAHFIDHFVDDAPWPTARAFGQRFRSRFGEAPTSLGGLGYDAACLLVDALGRAKESSRRGLRDALANTTDFEGVSGPLAMDGNRNPTKPGVVIRIQGGKPVYEIAVGPSAARLR